MSASFAPHTLPGPKAAALLALLALSPLHANPPKQKDPLPQPSVGRDVALSVERGGSIEIVLEGLAMPGDTVRFAVLTPPAHGSLSEPRRLAADSVAYTYQHQSTSAAVSDKAIFKLKTGPQKTWGRVTATIAIREPPPRLIIDPDPLDFGPVPIGETRIQPLRLRNAGGGLLQGTLRLGIPWSIEGPLEFTLAAGEARPFDVSFSPLGPGEQRSRLSIDMPTGGPAFISLAGEGVYRFHIPERIVFEPGPAGFPLEVPVSNLTGEKLELLIHAPPPLICSATALNLPPRGKAVFRLATQKKHYTAKSVELTIRDGEAMRGVRVDLPAPPALLEWISREGVVDLGEFPLRHTARAGLEIQNRGLTGANVELRELPGGLMLESDQARSFELRSGESAVVRAVWRLPEVPGEYSSGLIASHGGLDHPLQVKARVLPEPLASGRQDQTRAASPTPAPEERRILTAAEREELTRRMPREISYRIVPKGRLAEAIVSWKSSGTEPVEFRLEKKIIEHSKTGLEEAFQQRLQVPAELPPSQSLVKWIPATHQKPPVRHIGNNAWEASATDLEPGYHELRLVTRAPPDGPRIDFSSFTVRVDPLPPDPLWNWLSGTIGILCLLYLLRKKIRRLLGRPPQEE